MPSFNYPIADGNFSGSGVYWSGSGYEISGGGAKLYDGSIENVLIYPMNFPDNGFKGFDQITATISAYSWYAPENLIFTLEQLAADMATVLVTDSVAATPAEYTYRHDVVVTSSSVHADTRFARVRATSANGQNGVAEWRLDDVTMTLSGDNAYACPTATDLIHMATPEGSGRVSLFLLDELDYEDGIIETLTVEYKKTTDEGWTVFGAVNIYDQNYVGDLEDATYLFRVYGTDSDGHDGEYAAVYDDVYSGTDIVPLFLGAPIIAGTTPTSDSTPEWSWTPSGSPVAWGSGTYRWRLDNPDLTSPDGTGADLSFTPATPLSDGAHTLYVQEQDVYGVWGVVGSHEIVVAATAPSLVINPILPTTGASIAISGTTSGTVTSVIVDTTATAGAVTQNGSVWSCTISNLETGNNVVTVTSQGIAPEYPETQAQGTILKTVVPSARAQGTTPVIQPPKLPRLSSGVDKGVRQAFTAIEKYFSAVGVQGGTPTLQSFQRGGVPIPVSNLRGIDGWDLTGATVETAQPVYIAPLAPTNVTAQGGFAKIVVSWDEPDKYGYAYTEVYRASVDDINQKVLVGRTESPVYPDDNLPDQSLGQTYYYWVRHVSNGPVEGPFNDTAGTSAQTADDPGYILELLQDAKWQAETARSQGDLGYPTRPNGYAYEVTVAGTTGTVEPTWPTVVDQTVVDGTVTWKCKADLQLDTPFMLGLVNGVVKMVVKSALFGDATIKNASVESLGADKITAVAATIAETIIGTADITSAMINNLATDKLVAGSALIGSALIEELVASKIAAGIISAANIFLGSTQKVHLDGTNNRIEVKDSSNNVRVRLGKTGDGTYGIEILDAAGTTVLKSGGTNSINWGNVSGTGKPEDNATLGATIGTNLYGQMTSANISTYIASAAIGNALIENLATDKLVAGSALIGDALIANAAIKEAKIDSAAVTTLKVGSWAVSSPMGTTAAALGDTDCTSEVTVVSVTVSNADYLQKALITFTVQADYISNSFNEEFELYLYRDTTKIYTSGRLRVPEDSGSVHYNAAHTICLIDSSPTTSGTYYVKIKSTTSSPSNRRFDLGQCSMIIHGAKR